MADIESDKKKEHRKKQSGEYFISNFHSKIKCV